jgi:hypothetical protein
VRPTREQGIARDAAMMRTLVFGRLRAVRMVDVERNTLVYLTDSDRVIEGSPRISVTAVPVDRAVPIPLRWHEGFVAPHADGPTEALGGLLSADTGRLNVSAGGCRRLPLRTPDGVPGATAMAG